jgi:hypothetical protein
MPCIAHTTPRVSGADPSPGHDAPRFDVPLHHPNRPALTKEWAAARASQEW